MFESQEHRHKAVEIPRRSKKAAAGALGILLSVILGGSALAQSRHPIAGNYRGSVTRCLSTANPAGCRHDLAVIVRLADEADARHAGWMQARGGADNMLAQRLDAEYALALDELNQVITGFNKKGGFR